MNALCKMRTNDQILQSRLVYPTSTDGSMVKVGEYHALTDTLDLNVGKPIVWIGKPGPPIVFALDNVFGFSKLKWECGSSVGSARDCW